MSTENTSLLCPPDLTLLITEREAAAAQLKARLKELSVPPQPENFQFLYELCAFFEDQIDASLPDPVEFLEPIDLAELQKTEFLVYQLDFLYLIYYLEHQETLDLAEALPKYVNKVMRLKTLALSLTALAASPSSEGSEAPPSHE